MKAAPFDYVRAEDIGHALSLLAEHGMDAKLIAGGQSLVPMMAMRLARPAVLVDINRLAELQSIAIGTEHVRLGACVRQKDVETNAAVLRALPLVALALPWVGHQQTRNRGTVGGSLVHADPSAELPLSVLVLGGTLHLQSQAGGTRTVPASEFFMGPMFTATGEDECLTAIDWPVWSGARVGCAFEETSIRHGDFAMASAACQLQLGGDGRITRLAFGVGGVGSTPVDFPDIARDLLRQPMTPALARDAAHAAGERLEPHNDVHVQAPFRRHLAVSLIERVMLQAAAAAHA